MPRRPYLTVTDRDRRAFKLVANLTGEPEPVLLWGFLSLVEWLGGDGVEDVPLAQLVAFFGPRQEVRDGLVEFGVLVRDGDRYRIPGPSRWELLDVELDDQGRAPPFMAGERWRG